MEYMVTSGAQVGTGEGQGAVARLYGTTLARRSLLFAGLCILLVVLGIWAVSVGSYQLSLSEVIRSLMGLETGTGRIVVWSIRLPRITAAVVAGCGLGLSGVVTQSLLKNPLASPFTLGINQGAACGAAFAIVALGAGGLDQGALAASGPLAWSIPGVCAVTLCAFTGAMTATVVILVLARLRGMSPESVILAGIALSALFTSGTILIQYFASEVELAAVVFWTFGDVARSGWQELGILGAVTLAVLVYFLMNRWNLNALAAGEDEAQALGVNVTGLRLSGMILATLVAALVTAFHGVIAFLGLLAPHIGRRLVGGDHRLLLPFSCLIGALLLLGADTAGRLLVGSGALPVGVLTSFMGAPLFLFLLIRGIHR